MTTNRTSPTTPQPETKQPQLLLVLDGATQPSSWRIDEQTREIGRQGLAKAREALRAARPAHLELAA